MIYGKGLFERAGVAFPSVPPPPTCDGVEVAVGSAGERRCIRPDRGESFRDCPDCPEMVVVPEGSFMMGSPPGEKDGVDTEGQRKVTIARAFAVGKYEVTLAEWDACLADGGCKHRPNDEGLGRGKRRVINVSWDDISGEYLPWLSRKAGKTYRLLTEAEWEYAARAGSTTGFHFGNDEKDLCTYGNAKVKEKKKDLTITNCRGFANAEPGGSFRPNAFGLYDMLGNVWEWVEDCRNENYSGAPRDGSAWTTGDCGSRVLRGGSWFGSPWTFHSASRISNTSGDRSSHIGFRLARTLTP